LFPQTAVDKIKKFPFLEKLTAVFDKFSISNVVYGDTIVEGREEVYWRIVRPGVIGDVGPIHADKWFHNVLGSGYGMFPPGITTVKIWIPIYCESGRSGLIVVPNSHKRDWRYEYVEKNGFKKPAILEDVDNLGGELVPTDPGTLLIFNERLLHGGAVNRGEMTRVSIEITLVLGRLVSNGNREEVPSLSPLH
jgi:ectoine hydroxylase-related dioxygenase (phytanoyl-CoA dioxygenase family)